MITDLDRAALLDFLETWKKAAEKNLVPGLSKEEIWYWKGAKKSYDLVGDFIKIWPGVEEV